MERYNKIENAECFKFFENLFLLIYVSSSISLHARACTDYQKIFFIFFKIQPLFLTSDILVQVNCLKNANDLKLFSFFPFLFLDKSHLV